MKKIILMLCLLPWMAEFSFADLMSVPPIDSDRIAELVFENECSGKESKLVSWNEGEDFPSLGIGHFIWYREPKQAPFEESFPRLIDFFKSKGIRFPSALRFLASRFSPWRSRDEFIRSSGNPEFQALREFLMKTKKYQAEFLVLRFVNSIPRILDSVPPYERRLLEKKINLIKASKGGMYPLIDYVNFNGEGLLESERYHGLGWGLLQVLQEMDLKMTEVDALQEFVRAVEVILERRIMNAPPGRNEKKWLPGWKNRIATYGRLSVMS